ncbi:unnamed protein product [Polarella glacialis]|uniref:SAM-dependent MTase RsmB/NOP-type domain-containing protein n=1 Tax=Polarella glacialis TaxID=89957 RepID=A0A813E639_POLGL|nr:unnamed protein product [Polarella glacialis]
MAFVTPAAARPRADVPFGQVVRSGWQGPATVKQGSSFGRAATSERQLGHLLVGLFVAAVGASRLKRRRAKLEPWTDQSNMQFEAYYLQQGVCPAEEWQHFLDSLRTGLPIAVRVNLGSHVAAQLVEQLERLSSLRGDQLSALAPRKLPWFPRSLGWQWDELCGLDLRKDEQHERLRAYLAWLKDHGSLHRQEAVSMLPPLCLDVQPGQALLELCAAPGSKSQQIVDMLHWPQNSEQNVSPDAVSSGGLLPRGVLIANEVDSKRARVLSREVGRLCSPCFAMTCHDARYFPNLTDSDGSPFLFDRVLADVPCSCDGTLRKHAGIWDKWSVGSAMTLHPLQRKILCRGLALLKPGGRLVYSTCSFNPLEDEAVVVAALLRRHGGYKVTLVDLPHFEGLPAGCPGLQTWVVPHPKDAQVCWRTSAEVPEELRRRLLPSFFPPVAGSEEAAVWELQHSRCQRFLPHRTTGGGFFVAVFEKDVGLDVSHELSKVHDENDDVGPTNPGKQDEGLEGRASEGNDIFLGSSQQESVQQTVPGQSLRQVSDLEAVATDDSAWLEAAAFFGLDPGLACHLRRRQGQDTHPRQVLFWVSELAGRFLASRARCGGHVNSAGVRVLQQLGKSFLPGTPRWRVLQEGLPLLLQHGLKRRIAVSMSFMKRLLHARELEVSELHAGVEAGLLRGLESLMEDPSREELEEEPLRLIPGSLAVTLLPGDQSATPSAGPEVAVAAMLSGRSLTVFASVEEVASILYCLDLEARTTALYSSVEP